MKTIIHTFAFNFIANRHKLFLKFALMIDNFFLLFFLPRDLKYMLKKNVNFQLIHFPKEGILPLKKGSQHFSIFHILCSVH